MVGDVSTHANTKIYVTSGKIKAVFMRGHRKFSS